MVYEICLLGIAATYPVAVRAVARHRGRLADRVLGAVGSAGLPGLQHVLAGVLTDPCLRIECWDAVAAAFEPVTTDAAADAVANRDDEETVLVTDDGVLLARVVTASRVLADRGTADAVVEAVRLAVVNQRLDADLAARRMELEHSRRRLIAAADRERERSAASLRRDVGAALERALVTLSDIRPYDGAAPQLAEALAEVQAATGDVERIVFGVPPVPLGSGRLSDGLRLLVARSPTPGNLHADPVAASTPENEAALYYVCSEALANVAKHAAAKVADVTLAVGADSLVLTVRDDGVGGADVTGSGLLGLSDRLAAVNGSLEIDSRPGCGTTVTATVPRTTG
jgi:signal transduction histidine kinase